jgi:hypothetical protein
MSAQRYKRYKCQLYATKGEHVAGCVAVPRSTPGRRAASAVRLPSRKRPPRNNLIGSSCRRRRRANSVVPFAVEVVRLEIHERELLVRDSAALRVDPIIDSATDSEAGLRRRGGDQAHDDLMGDERLATPVLGDEREQEVLDLVPLARPRGQLILLTGKVNPIISRRSLSTYHRHRAAPRQGTRWWELGRLTAPA